jgi:quinoprotein glucose dehydrogenase
MSVSIAFYTRFPLLILALAVAGSAQRSAATAAQEWRTYDHDLAGTRFSPLTHINAGNVSKLEQAWTFNVPPPPGGRGGGGLLSGSEAVPLVLAGVMYLPAGNTVVALEADTGKAIWQREIRGGPPGAVSRRGVGYWPGDGTTPARVFATAGRRLLSLAALSGKPSEGFGTNGEVDMIVGYAGTPTIYKNVIVVGASVNEVPLGPPGDTRAFDAITGRKPDLLPGEEREAVRRDRRHQSGRGLCPAVKNRATSSACSRRTSPCTETTAPPARSPERRAREPQASAPTS